VHVVAVPQLQVSTFWQSMMPIVEMVVWELELDETRLLAAGLVHTRWTVKEYAVRPVRLVATHVVTLEFAKVAHPRTVALTPPPVANCTSQLEKIQSPALPADHVTVKSAKPTILETVGAPGVEALTGGALM